MSAQSLGNDRVPEIVCLNTKALDEPLNLLASRHPAVKLPLGLVAVSSKLAPEDGVALATATFELDLNLRDLSALLNI